MNSLESLRGILPEKGRYRFEQEPVAIILLPEMNSRVKTALEDSLANDIGSFIVFDYEYDLEDWAKKGVVVLWNPLPIKDILDWLSDNRTGIYVVNCGTKYNISGCNTQINLLWPNHNDFTKQKLFKRIESYIYAINGEKINFLKT